MVYCNELHAFNNNVSCSFLLGGPEENRTTSPINHVFLGSAMGSAHTKNDANHFIQDNLTLESIPISQNDASMSSENSQCSSGYYSDSSYSDSLKGS